MGQSVDRANLQIGPIRPASPAVDGTVKPTLRAASDLRTAVKAYRGRFKNAGNKGLDDEGFARKWLEQNSGDTVVMRDGSTRTKDDYGL